MPLYSEHISNMYYSGMPHSSAPYSYSSSSSNPYGLSYSASYLSPGAGYSSHSSLGGYSRPHTSHTSRWTPSSSRNYSPLLGTISERGASSPARITSPRRLPLSKRSYGSSTFTPRPININTADIDVSLGKYRNKTTCMPATSTAAESIPLEVNNGPFMPRVDGKSNTEEDSSSVPQRNTIKRGRTVVRLHTIKRKDKDSPRKPNDEPSSDNSKESDQSNENKESEGKSWRERLSDDLVYKDKREKKTIGAKLVEKFAVKDRDSPTKELSPPIEKIETVSRKLDTPLIHSDSRQSPNRRCSMELLAEQTDVLDSLIRSENLSTTSLDLSKIGTVQESDVIETRNIPQTAKRKKGMEEPNPLQTTKSDHSLYNRGSLKESKENNLISKRRSLKKSSSGGSIFRLGSITENSDLPTIDENKYLLKPISEVPKIKNKITSSVEVSPPPTSPLKLKVENIVVEEKTSPTKKNIFFTSSVDEEQSSKADKDLIKEPTLETEINTKPISPDPDDGNFWNKIVKRETVYLMRRKQNIEAEREKSRRALYWFPEGEECGTSEDTNATSMTTCVDDINQNIVTENILPKTLNDNEQQDILKTLTSITPSSTSPEFEVITTKVENTQKEKVSDKIDLKNAPEKIIKTSETAAPKICSEVEITPKEESSSKVDLKTENISAQDSIISKDKIETSEIAKSKISTKEKASSKIDLVNENTSAQETVFSEEKIETSEISKPKISTKAKTTPKEKTSSKIDLVSENTSGQETVFSEEKIETSEISKPKISTKAKTTPKEKASSKIDIVNENTSAQETVFSEEKIETSEITKSKISTKVESGAQGASKVKTSGKVNQKSENISAQETIISKEKIETSDITPVEDEAAKQYKNSEDCSCICDGNNKNQNIGKDIINKIFENSLKINQLKTRDIETESDQNKKVDKNIVKHGVSISNKLLKKKGNDYIKNEPDKTECSINHSSENLSKDSHSPEKCSKDNQNKTQVPIIPITVTEDNSETTISVVISSENIPVSKIDMVINLDQEELISGEKNKAKKEEPVIDLPKINEKDMSPISDKSPVASSKKPVKEQLAIRPLIATPKPLQKKAPQIINTSSSSESSSEDESTDEDADESDSSEDSAEFFECENNPDGRTSTGSNDSGFDSSAPTSPAGFTQMKKDCDVNCHRKCEKLTANLCGVKQKLLVEALASKSVSKRCGDSSGPSGNVSKSNSSDIVEKELEQSTAYGIFRKTGRFTPPARSIPRFRKYNIEDFNFIKVLGKGSFGKVMLAELRDTEYYYAVKCLKKDVVLEDDDVECTLIERKVLALGTNHPYLCHLFATFQTDSHLFFVMEYLNGGDLMFHIQQSGRFPEPRAIFYAAEIVSGLKFLHKRGIVYRDLKLDNILLDYDGHVRIADFGMCKLQVYLEKTADTFCGTPDYMAPEIIKGLKYTQTVDWWSFGVLLYEMLIGQSPFSGCDEDELFWSICNETPDYPRFLSQDSLHILTRLLDKDARTRLGGTESIHGDIREQEFFRSVHWDKLDRRELETPFKPKVRHPLDTQYFDRAFTGERPRLTAVEPQVLRSMDQEPFRGFSYTNPNATDR